MKRTMAIVLLVVMLLSFIVPVIFQALATSNNDYYNVKIETYQVYS